MPWPARADIEAFAGHRFFWIKLGLRRGNLLINGSEFSHNRKPRLANSAGRRLLLGASSGLAAALK